MKFSKKFMKSVSNSIEISINFQFSNQFSAQFEKNSYRFYAQFCPKLSEKLFSKSLLFFMKNFSLIGKFLENILYPFHRRKKTFFLDYQKNYNQIIFRYQMIYYPKRRKKVE